MLLCLLSKKPLFALAGVTLFALAITAIAAEPNANSPPTLSKEEAEKIADENWRRGFDYDALQKEVFSKIGTLNCGQAKIVITTTCLGEESTYCFHQNVAFVAKSGHIKNVSYGHPFRDGSPPFVPSASCVKIKQQHYVMLAGVNFRLCTSICEWHDFFTHRGQYLGSTLGWKGATSFTRKLVSDRFFYRMMGGDPVIQPNGKVELNIIRIRD